MDDEYLDYWEEDSLESGQEGWISIYTLPPAAAVLISLVLAALMITYAQQKLSGLDYSAISLSDLAAEPDSPLPALQAAPPFDDEIMIAPLFTRSVRHWASEIMEWSREWGIDPNLAATVMQIESCGHPSIASPAGASGLFQVMPYHFKPGERAEDPDTNAYRGLSYLSRALDAHGGDVYWALAGYNAGIGGSKRGEANWPSETKRYTYWGAGIYADAAAGLMVSERLDEWLAAGGAGLCRKAEAVLGLQ